MWPWEHVAFGYLLYSMTVHVVRRTSPSGGEAFVLAVAAVLPDLVDKPLSWTFGLVPSGYSVFHSIFVAPILALAVTVVAHRRGRTELGLAFGIGYASHLLGDIIYPLLSGDAVAPSKVLWPLVTLPAYEAEYSFVQRALFYFLEYAHRLLQLEFGPLLLFELSLTLLVFGLWMYDGAPGVRLLGNALHRGGGRR